MFTVLDAVVVDSVLRGWAGSIDTGRIQVAVFSCDFLLSFGAIFGAVSRGEAGKQIF